LLDLEAPLIKRLLILNTLIFCYLLTGTGTPAQTSSTDVCPSTGKLICAIPEVFGPAGLQQKIGPLEAGTGTGTGHKGGHFEADFLNSLAPLNAAVGSELTLLPIGSPGSGLVYVYDPTLKTFTASTEDLGPILTERATTTGRHKVRLGFSYQRFSFSTLDGASLHSLPASFTHVPDASDHTGTISPPTSVAVSNCSIGSTPPAVPQTQASNEFLCGLVRDRIDTVTDIHLTLNQYTVTATFGLTRRIDVSLAIPIINVGMNVSSSATIINNSNTDDHLFQAKYCASGAFCRSSTFSTANSASGIGDLVVRAKGVVWSGERAAVAVAADLRIPTGDEQNFLGSGTIGFTPFVVFSYAARVSPHVNVGYEVNGNSTLAGTINAPVQSVTDPTVATSPSSFTQGHLPNQFLYSGGADVVLLPKRLAGTFDFIGQRVISAERATVTTQSFLGPCSPNPSGETPASPDYCSSPLANVSRPALSETRSSFNILNAALGAKVRISDKFIVFGNALFKLDNGGLRARVVPLVGASFSF
jgi:hypothetical protein